MAIEIEQLTSDIGATTGTVIERAERLCGWLHESLDWVATDYEQRTVEEILERRAGNCAEQAKVFDALLGAAGIETRWIAEINIHPPSDQRLADSKALVAQYGTAATVFGRRHNDHRWLEFHDPESGGWLPADATLAVVGLPAWIEARLGFGPRSDEAADMLVPFCVVVLDPDRTFRENRTEHYLVESFGARSQGFLEQLPTWTAWCEQVCELGHLGAETFRNNYDLHQEDDRIGRCLETYRQLACEARR